MTSNMELELSYPSLPYDYTGATHYVDHYSALSHTSDQDQEDQHAPLGIWSVIIVHPRRLLDSLFRIANLGLPLKPLKEWTLTRWQVNLHLNLSSEFH